MHHEALDAFALAFASRKSVSAFTEKVQRRRNSTGEGRWDGAARASFTLRLRVSRVTLRHRGEPGHTPKTQPRTAGQDTRANRTRHTTSCRDTHRFRFKDTGGSRDTTTRYRFKDTGGSRGTHTIPLYMCSNTVLYR